MRALINVVAEESTDVSWGAWEVSAPSLRPWCDMKTKKSVGTRKRCSPPLTGATGPGAGDKSFVDYATPYPDLTKEEREQLIALMNEVVSGNLLKAAKILREIADRMEHEYGDRPKQIT